jgi:hypothetical protein
MENINTEKFQQKGMKKFINELSSLKNITDKSDQKDQNPYNFSHYIGRQCNYTTFLLFFFTEESNM